MARPAKKFPNKFPNTTCVPERQPLRILDTRPAGPHLDPVFVNE